MSKQMTNEEIMAELREKREEVDNLIDNISNRTLDLMVCRRKLSKHSIALDRAVDQIRDMTGHVNSKEYIKNKLFKGE